MHIVEFVSDAGHPVYVVASKVVSFQACSPGSMGCTQLSLDGGVVLSVREGVHQVRMLLEATERASEARG